MADNSPEKTQAEALEIARAGGHEVDALIDDMEHELEQSGGLERGFFNIEFKDPRHFTWLLVAFASMGGLLSGLDQSLISGANLYLPKDLGLSDRQNSLVNSGMPLGAVGGALLLSPTNEYFGRKWAILISIMLYTVGAGLEAGSINYGRVIYVSPRPIQSELNNVLMYRYDCCCSCHPRPWCWPGGWNCSRLCRRDCRASHSRKSGIIISIQHRPRRGSWVCRRSRVSQSPRQLAIHPWILTGLFHHHVHWVRRLILADLTVP